MDDSKKYEGVIGPKQRAAMIKADNYSQELARTQKNLRAVSMERDSEREARQKAEAEVERLKNDFNRLKTLMHQTIWFVDDMIKTHTNGCEDCHKKHGAMIALFKDITEEPQWPIDPTDK